MASLVSEFVVFSNGAVDQEASLLAFATALSDFIAESELYSNKILVEANAFFDENYGARVPVPFFVSRMLQVLGANASNFQALTDRVEAFVAANKGDIGSGALLHVQKGKNGGVARLSEVKVK